MSATYSLQEVASEMRLEDMADPVRWLTKHIRSGRITARKVGRSWRMTRDDIESALDVFASGKRPAPISVDRPRGSLSAASARRRLAS